jgi:hypothetical protein
MSTYISKTILNTLESRYRTYLQKKGTVAANRGTDFYGKKSRSGLEFGSGSNLAKKFRRQNPDPQLWFSKVS